MGFKSGGGKSLELAGRMV